jgi:hypothetical protein
MKLVCLSLCGLIGVLNLTGCSRKSTPAIPAAPEVLVTTVAPRDVPVIKEGVATLNGFINANISARVSGYVIFAKTTSKEASLRRATFFFKLIPGHSKENPHADKKSPSAYRIQLFPSNAILCISITSANLLL